MQNSNASKISETSESLNSENLSAVIVVNYLCESQKCVTLDTNMWNRILRALQQPEMPLVIR